MWNEIHVQSLAFYTTHLDQRGNVSSRGISVLLSHKNIRQIWSVRTTSVRCACFQANRKIILSLHTMSDTIIAKKKSKPARNIVLYCKIYNTKKKTTLSFFAQLNSIQTPATIRSFLEMRYKNEKSTWTHAHSHAHTYPYTSAQTCPAGWAIQTSSEIWRKSSIHHWICSLILFVCWHSICEDQ